MTELNKHKKIVIGLISDTHGYLPAAVHEIFNAVDGILHAGDIGEPGILDELRLIAPVEAVRGNMDWSDWGRKLPDSQVMTFGHILIGLIHDLHRQPVEFETAGVRVIIDGHTHRAQIVEQNGVLHVNPGSAGQPRHNRPSSVGLLRITGPQVEAELVQLGQAHR